MRRRPAAPAPRDGRRGRRGRHRQRRRLRHAQLEDLQRLLPVLALQAKSWVKARRGSRNHFWEVPNPRIYPYFETLCKLSTNNYEMIQIDTYIHFLLYMNTVRAKLLCKC